MIKDIVNRTDIELLVNYFYGKIVESKELGFIFQEVAKVNWSTHLPTMYDFWENIILFSGNYKGNPLHLHKNLHYIKPLNETHFDEWNRLFIDAVDELFEGSKADLAKQRAISISEIIKKNILEYQQEISELE